MVSSNDYETQREIVLISQAKRVASQLLHDDACNCNDCINERSARRILEKFPEHSERQKSWRTFMEDLLNGVAESQD